MEWRKMAQNLKLAGTKSQEVLELIGKKELSSAERKHVIEDAVNYWTDHVNPGFLQYRKSVSTDYTAVEWDDSGAVFRDVNGQEFIDVLGGYGVYNVGHRHPKVLKAVREQLERQAIHSQELIDPLRTYLAHLVSLITPGDFAVFIFYKFRHRISRSLFENGHAHHRPPPYGGAPLVVFMAKHWAL